MDWTAIFEDRETDGLNYATVKVADALAPEESRRLALGAVTRALGWVRQLAPYGEFTPHREPVRVYVTAPAPGAGGIREVFLDDALEPAAVFRLRLLRNPSGWRVVTA